MNTIINRTVGEQQYIVGMRSPHQENLQETMPNKAIPGDVLQPLVISILSENEIRMNTIDKIRNWYQDERVEVPITRGVIGLPLVYFVPSRSARCIRALITCCEVTRRFWIRNWISLVGMAIGGIGVYLAYLQLRTR